MCFSLFSRKDLNSINVWWSLQCTLCCPWYCILWLFVLGNERDRMYSDVEWPFLHYALQTVIYHVMLVPVFCWMFFFSVSPVCVDGHGSVLWLTCPLAGKGSGRGRLNGSMMVAWRCWLPAGLLKAQGPAVYFSHFFAFLFWCGLSCPMSISHSPTLKYFSISEVCVWWLVSFLSDRVQRTILRNFLMHGFHFVVWFLCVRGIKDTQVCYAPM